MARKRTPPKNYDYTASARSAARYDRAAMMLSPIALDAQHADALTRIVAATGETKAACVRRLIIDEAVRRHAPIDREG